MLELRPLTADPKLVAAGVPRKTRGVVRDAQFEWLRAELAQRMPPEAKKDGHGGWQLNMNLGCNLSRWAHEWEAQKLATVYQTAGIE